MCFGIDDLLECADLPDTQLYFTFIATTNKLHLLTLGFLAGLELVFSGAK